MSKLYQLPEEEKNRIRNLHLTESKNKKISSILNEAIDDSKETSLSGGEKKGKMSGPQMTDAGDYHMWENCNGGQTVALYHNQLSTAAGDSCFNASNQGNPGLVLACTQALVTAWGPGPVLQWMAGDVMSCWKYQGTQFFNTIPNAASPTQGAGYQTPTVLSNCSQCGPQGGDLAWMCMDVAVVGGTGCQQLVCPYGNIATAPQWWNVFGGCWTNQIDCDNNAGNGGGPCTGYSGPEHECTNGQCIPTQGGQYPTQAACQAVCATVVQTNYCVNCVNQVMSYYPGMPSGSQTSCGPGFVDIGPNPSPSPGPCHECVNNNCIQGNGWLGNFNSMSDCQNGTPSQPACQTTLVDDYECVNGGCIIQSGGQFNAGPTSQDNLNACNAACPPPNNWLCAPNTGCSQDPSGTHPDQATCETACCVQTITSWGWGPYQSGSPTCHEICAKLNTQAMILAAAGTPLNFKHKCRYDWLIAQFNSLGCPACSLSNGCCDNSGYISASMAVQFQVSSDPHCVNANTPFISDVEDAMNGNNAQNTPFGCNYLIQKQQNIIATITSSTSAGALCNKQGRIAWLDEIMSTGDAPGFTPNPVTMTALYPGGTFVVC